MLIKTADSKDLAIAALQATLDDPLKSPSQKSRAATNLLFLKAGLRAEKEAAYEIDFHYAASNGWAVLHDFRIEVDGRVAQIDHLVINRLLQVAVLETKSFSEGVGLNEHGEFVQFYQGRPRGIASPVAQNERHIAVLNSLFKNNRGLIPTRLGVPITPFVHGLVIVSKTARISRPKVERPEARLLLKIDQLSDRLDNEFEKQSLLRIVSTQTLQLFANALAAFHCPAPAMTLDSPATTSAWAPDALVQATEPRVQTKAVSTPDIAPATSGATKLQCNTCAAEVPYAVAKFCWMNKTRFKGKVYCRDHQTP